MVPVLDAWASATSRVRRRASPQSASKNGIALRSIRVLNSVAPLGGSVTMVTMIGDHRRSVKS
jgi:hypothetical protein